MMFTGQLAHLNLMAVRSRVDCEFSKIGFYKPEILIFSSDLYVI